MPVLNYVKGLVIRLVGILLVVLTLCICIVDMIVISVLTGVSTSLMFVITGTTYIKGKKLSNWLWYLLVILGPIPVEYAATMIKTSNCPNIKVFFKEWIKEAEQI